MSTPHHHHPAGWRQRPVGGVARNQDARALSTLILMAGGWLVVSPTVLGYTGGDPVWSEVVFGGLIALVALIRLTRSVPLPALGWLNALSGTWVFVSAFWLAESTAAGWNELLTGALVVMLAVLSTAAPPGDDGAEAGPR